MKHKSLLRNCFDILVFVLFFFAIQAIVPFIAGGVYGYVHKESVAEVVEAMASGKYSQLLAVTTVFSSLLTIVLYARLHWAPISRVYLLSRPWGVVVWAVLLAIGTILPTEWLYELLQIALPDNLNSLFEGVMKEPWGYVAVGLLAPLAEELVFRGAVLRTLLRMFDRRWHWLPIGLSALIFGVVHLNLAQGAHAFLIGLLLGWMYYRTDSIIPSVIFHWVNNSVAFAMFHIMPQMSDGKLIDLFHGSDRLMYLGIGCSLCILLPSLLQLALRMHKANQGK